jgi:hypothetical protein
MEIEVRNNEEKRGESITWIARATSGTDNPDIMKDESQSKSKISKDRFTVIDENMCVIWS